MNTMPKWLVDQYQKRAQAERDAGTTIEINRIMGYIAVAFESGEEYLFDGSETDELLGQVPSNIGAEDFILAQAQNW